MIYIKFILFNLTLSLFIMNYLKYDPEKIYNYSIYIRRTVDYNCFNFMIKYNIDIHPFYQYFCSIEEYKLKNIWNFLIYKWNIMNHSLIDNTKYIQSNYPNQYKYIHTTLTDHLFNNLLIDFINNDKCKAIFAMNCIFHISIP